MMGGYAGSGWAGWLTMALAMVVFWGLVVFAVVAVFRGSRENQPADGLARQRPLQILDERFARGEISVEEYEARQSVLRGEGR